MKLMNIVAHQIDIDPRFFHQRLSNAPNDQIIDGYLGIGRFIQLRAMRQQSVEFVFGSQIKVGNGLLGFCEPPRNGLAGSSEWDHVDTRRCATATTGGCFDILIGNASAAPRTGDGAQVDTQFVYQSAHAGRGARVSVSRLHGLLCSGVVGRGCGGGFRGRAAVRRDKGIDITVCDAGIGNHAEKGADRVSVTRRHQHATKNAVDR